jgi:hypothetical protein
MNRRGFFGMLAGLFGWLLLPKRRVQEFGTPPKRPFIEYPNPGWNAPTVWSIVPAEEIALPALRSYVEHCQRRLDSAKEVLKRAESKCLP